MQGGGRLLHPYLLPPPVSVLHRQVSIRQENDESMICKHAITFKLFLVALEILFVLFQKLIIFLVLLDQRQIFLLQVSENIHQIFRIRKRKRIVFIVIVFEQFTQFMRVCKLIFDSWLFLLLSFLPSLSTQGLVISNCLPSSVLFFFLHF